MSAAAPGRILFVAANPSVDRLYSVERLTVGAIHRPLEVVAVPGGKGLNAARAAARLGGRVTAIGIIGGRAGDWIEDRLRDRGIAARWVRTDGETRTCVSILDRSDGATTEVYERGQPLATGSWEELEGLVADELRTGDVAAIPMSGSLPPGAPGDGFARIAALGRTAAATGSREVAVLADTYGPALEAVLAELPAVVKINATEATDATGLAVVDRSTAEQAAAILRARGARAVVITLGAAGAVVVDEAGSEFLAPPAAPGAYPVGSGDAFLAGLAVGLVRGDDLVTAAKLGRAAGIANAARPGAGELELADVEAILAGDGR